MKSREVTSELSYCATQVRAHDPDRFLTCLFAPVERREALFALYALNYEIAKTREVVREPIMGRIRLQWWRDAIDELYRGQVREHQVLTALAGVLPGRVPAELIMQLIDARELDLEDSGPPTSSSLIDYTRATGGALMQMAARLLGATDEALLHAADDLGEGTALTGLLRAIPFHATQNRLYLPADLLRQMGLDPSRPVEQGNSSLEVVTYLMALEAERLLRSAPRYIPRAFAAAYLPATLAQTTLRRLRKTHHDPFDAMMAAPDALKPLRLANAWATGRV